MPWNENHTTLNYLLADLYDDKDDSKRIAKAAGMSTGLIAFNNQAYTNWFHIIDQAEKQDALIPLLRFVLGANEPAGRDKTMKQVLSAIIVNLEENKIPFTSPVANIDWKEDHDEKGYEKILGSKSTLLPIGFLEKGLLSAASVVKITVGNGLGTGFLIDGNWVVTNNHVIPSKKDAADAVICCNFQQNIAGLDLASEEFKLDPDGGYFTSKEDDWTIVKAGGDLNAKYGALTLSNDGVSKDDFVNIIQHPSGGPKQIALYHNTVTAVDDKYVLYLTDTMPGSSGSPVFNSEWEVVALHHWGGNTKEPYANMKVYRNRGIKISKIKKAILDNHII